MDYGFHRRLCGKPLDEPELDILLALASAAQATSPTARAQARVADPAHTAQGLATQIMLFGTPDGRATAHGAPHRFAAIAPETRDDRQPS